MIEVGKEMHWHKINSNYGHISVYRVRVKKLGKRATVEVLDRDGTVTRTTVCRHEHLREIPTQQ